MQRRRGASEGAHVTEPVTCGQLRLNPHGAEEPYTVSPGDVPITEVTPGCYSPHFQATLGVD